MRIDESTVDHFSIRTLGPNTLWSTSPPEMMQPALTMESSALPRMVNFAPGNCGRLVQIGQSVL